MNSIITALGRSGISVLKLPCVLAGQSMSELKRAPRSSAYFHRILIPLFEKEVNYFRSTVCYSK